MLISRFPVKSASESRSKAPRHASSSPVVRSSALCPTGAQLWELTPSSVGVSGAPPPACMNESHDQANASGSHAHGDICARQPTKHLPDQACGGTVAAVETSVAAVAVRSGARLGKALDATRPGLRPGAPPQSPLVF